MATAAAGIDRELLSAIRSKLEAIPEVLSIAYRIDDGLISFWIGVLDCDHSARKSIYGVEDSFATQFGIQLEFNLVTLALGENLRRYVSTAAPLYQRSA